MLRRKPAATPAPTSMPKAVKLCLPQKDTRLAQVFVAVVLVLLAMPMAHADVCILSSSGDMVEDYLRTFAQIRQSGERVIIDGPLCLYSCAQHDFQRSAFA